MMGAQSGQGINVMAQGGSPSGEAPYSPAQVPLTPPEPEEPESEEDQLEREQEISFHKKNLAENLSEDMLGKICNEAKLGYLSDLDSMTDWLEANREWSKLARQVKEEKTFPWQGASNIKFPLISTAALQFSARAYPALVPADKKVVKTRMFGKDPSGEKRKKGERIATYMSWQFTYDIPLWEEEMDKLLIMNPVVGQTYKKTYFDPIQEKVVSCLIYPENFVIDYWARSLKACPRYTEVHLLTKQEIEERQRTKYFLDVDLGTPTGPSANRASDGSIDNREKSVNDYTVPYEILEQHGWYDTDEDGIREPVIIWFDQNSSKILRIQARYDAKGIRVAEVKGKPKVVGFEAKCYYTKFGFIPNPDGSFFDLGFGNLLGPINEAVNTNINQLTDAGTLNTMNAGFVAKGLRLNMADTQWQPGEWKSVNATGDDLRKLIIPLPTKEPSPVLFQLLGMLVQSGKELASVAEIFTGKMPGQNTPATTTMATVEQGMKVFTAIYKRIYRSLDEEFKKVFYLNKYYLNKDTYVRVLDEAIGPDDFDDEVYDVCPTADPTATTQAEKLQKAQALLELAQFGIMDPVKILMRVLEAQEQPNWEELIPGMAETGQPAPPQEKQDPKLQAQMMKAQTDAQMAEKKMAMEEKKAQMDLAMKNADLQMKQQEHQLDLQHKQQMGGLEAQSKVQMNQIFMAEARSKAMASAMQGQQKLRQGEEAHQQKLKQTKEATKSKPTKSAKPAKTSSQ
jgi:chaperonin GroES